MRFAFIPLLVTQAWAVQATCQLTLEPPGSGFNVLSMTVDPLPAEGFDLPPSTDTCDLNGSMNATLDVDLTTHKTSELTLTSGTVFADDGDPGDDDFIFGGSARDGLTTVTYDLRANGLSTVVFTTTRPGAMTSIANGEFDASEHTFNVIGGTLEGDITVNVFGFPPSVNPIDRTVSEEEPIAGTGNGTGTVTLTPTGSSPGSYNVTLILPISSFKTYQNAEGTADSFTVETNAIIKATGTLQVPVGAPKIESVGMIPGNKLQIQISGLAPGSDYLLTESGDLSSFGVPAGSVTADTVAAPGGAFTATGATTTLEVVLPAGTSAFYRVEDAP
ncbi:hypothetical protein [Haloferula sp. A504]|uniref:hypothetical protein n=1 Tax=Haloferula sp. A504 TaxID=3373601 RepID=UPI0037BECAA8